MVELRTTHDVTFYTDSAGVAAIFDPALMNKTVWFKVSSDGYQFEGSFAGGVRLKVDPNNTVTLQIERKNVAERIYRVTGHGIYQDTKLLGEAAPIDHPILNAGVMGQDSVLNAVFRDKLYWFWGDTKRPRKAIGILRSTGAISELPQNGGLDPDTGVNLQYFTDETGRAKRVFPPPPDTKPIWLTNLMVLEDEFGRQQMFAHYTAIDTADFSLGSFTRAVENLRNPETLSTLAERGVGQWNPEREIFERVAVGMPKKIFRNTLRVHEDGQEWFYFGQPFPYLRVPATIDAIQDPDRYQFFTPLKPGTTRADSEVEGTRDDPVWAWKNDAPFMDDFLQARMIRDDRLASDEGLLNLRDFQQGEEILVFGGRVYWNNARQKWVMIFSRIAPSSPVEEVWYSEADSPLGPWVYARKVTDHDNTSCYLPNQHRPFDQNGGRTVYFECTFANLVTGSKPKPGYNYNQMMYKLNLNDTRLYLPVSVYHYQDRQGSHRYDTLKGLEGDTASALGRIAGVDGDSIAENAPIPFFALPVDRAREQSVPVWEERTRQGIRLILRETTRADSPVFYALPPDVSSGNPSVVSIYEYENTENGRFIYSPPQYAPSGPWVRSTDPVFQAWASPNLNPERNPGAEPVEVCMGASAVCE